MNKDLAIKIKKWKEFEQKLRFQAGKEYVKNNQTGIHNDLVYMIDAINNIRIKKIIRKFGYPTQKLIGKSGVKDFWLLIQHQDEDLALQQECLANCNFAPIEKAYLTDRILLAEGKKQKFGTQFMIKHNKRAFRPLENKMKVNTLRKSIGLETLEKYLEKANKLIKK